MSDEQVPPETRGVEVKVLATVDLAGEIEGMAWRELRMRMVTVDIVTPSSEGGAR
jgi:hypothetical protein